MRDSLAASHYFQAIHGFSFKVAVTFPSSDLIREPRLHSSKVSSIFVGFDYQRVGPIFILRRSSIWRWQRIRSLHFADFNCALRWCSQHFPVHINHRSLIHWNINHRSLIHGTIKQGRHLAIFIRQNFAAIILILNKIPERLTRHSILDLSMFIQQKIVAIINREQDSPKNRWARKFLGRFHNKKFWTWFYSSRYGRLVL